MSVKRTYISRSRPSLASLPSSDSMSPSPERATLSLKRKAHDDHVSSRKRFKDSALHAAAKRQKKLSQLHFIPDTGSSMRSCPDCEMSYTRGATEDETLHRAHCARVVRGMEWGREEERDGKSKVEEIVRDVRLKGQKTGRIIAVRADATGKIGSKLKILFKTINQSLSAPDLPPDVLRSSKAYLFLIPSSSPTFTSTFRERIAGCVIASHITTAMSIVHPTVLAPISNYPEKIVSVSLTPTRTIFLSPVPLPTSLGIPRMFVSVSYRRSGIAHALLDAAAAYFIHGCPLDPRKGEVAFSQPTTVGETVMKSWGAGGVRIYEE